jgi:hypothetical protein
MKEGRECQTETKLMVGVEREGVAEFARKAFDVADVAGFAEEIFCAQTVGFFFGFLRIFAGEHDDGDGGEFGALLQPGEDVEAVHAGHDEIEEDYFGERILVAINVNAGAHDVGDKFAAVRNGMDVAGETGFAQGADEQHDIFFRIVDDED